jgi:magnesium transporter
MDAGQTSTERIDDVLQLANEISRLAPAEAGTRLMRVAPEHAVKSLERVGASTRHAVLARMKEPARRSMLEATDPRTRKHWQENVAFPGGTIGSLMDAPVGVFSPDQTIGEAIEELRQLVKAAFITYGWVVDPDHRLIGVLVMRELMLGERTQRLSEIMLTNPFFLTPEMVLTDAMKAVLNRHYPVYPVCDREGRLVGLVRGQTLFEAQAIEISAQAGSMVGVEKEERISTPWPRCLRFRHPWLQLNLFTAFIAAAVVGVFQETIDEIVVLAVFLPVLAGQSGNTGCQALAVSLRAMTLGEFQKSSTRRVLSKEAVLGLFNGALVGLTAGLGMTVYATIQNTDGAVALGLIVFLAMVGSCIVSGISGVLVPVTLRRLGADPASASSIFLTTATDVVSMGAFLGLATLFLV